MLDLNQVRMFVQVVRAKSFAEAARRLGVPSNSLSRHVRELEAKLETRLMQRSTRKLTLTSAGVAFYERCAPAVDTQYRWPSVSPTPWASRLGVVIECCIGTSGAEVTEFCPKRGVRQEPGGVATAGSPEPPMVARKARASARVWTGMI